MSPEKRQHPFRPDLWGGIECTICRTREGYSDQLAHAGHYARFTDINRFSELGIKALRYPILWERHQPELGRIIDWAWADRQLNALRELDIVPIAGLLHHGSGPSFTGLDQPGFPEQFAAYAGQVARRFPWIDLYTPVNEPLTTARFSGLYGLWYPHKQEASAFIRMLLNQIKATVMAMKAIRKVNPGAKLVQTEDLAKIHSTPKLSYQADFENERRWLTFDLLCGKVNRSHPLWDYLIITGIKEGELFWFSDNPCIPDIIGANYYITSERFLDEDIAKYPGHTHGGNGTIAYADVEAVRAVPTSGLASLLDELHNRYQLPIAITEVHLHCTREEQLRWFHEVWQTACRACSEGIDIRAVTSWALLGAFDWDSLLTRRDLHYEPGAYALHGNKPELTAVGHLLMALGRGADPDHPLLDLPGWWNRRPGQDHASRLLIFREQPGSAACLADVCRQRGIVFQLLANSGDPWIIPDPHHTWGVVELCGYGSNGSLWGLCNIHGLPHLACPEEIAGNKRRTDEMNELMDAFIDKVMAMAWKDDHINITYG